VVIRFQIVCMCEMHRVPLRRFRIPRIPVEAAKIGGTEPSEVPFGQTQVYGKVHSDTTSFNDSHQLVKALNEVEIQTARISKIEVWSASSINGIQVYCKYKKFHTSPDSEEEAQFTGLHHFGPHGNPSLSTIEFHKTEFLIGIRGRIGEFMDHLVIQTNERTFNFGTSPGGLSFEIKLPFYHKALGFVGGTGGHIHSLGVVWLLIDHWSPENHMYFPKDFKATVRLLMLASAQKENLLCKLPKDILFYVFHMVAMDVIQHEKSLPPAPRLPGVETLVSPPAQFRET